VLLAAGLFFFRGCGSGGPSGDGTVAEQKKKEGKATGEGPAGERQPNLAYIAPDFGVALVLHPRQALKSPVLANAPQAPLNEMFTDLMRETGINGREVEQFLLLFEPLKDGPGKQGGGGDPPVIPAGIVRMAAAADLTKFLDKALEGKQEQTFKGQKYYKSVKKQRGDVYLAGCLTDDRTALLAPEPTLHKMLTAGPKGSGPLADKLGKMNWNADALAVVVVEPFRAMATEFARSAGNAVPPPLAEATSLPERLQGFTVAVNLGADPLLRLICECKDAESGKVVAGLLRTGLDFLKLGYPQLREQMLGQVMPELAQTLLLVTDQIYEGVKVNQEGPWVTMDLKRPAGLGEPPPPGLIASSGFNDAKGLNSNPVPASPFKLGARGEPGGLGEPGWEGPWMTSPNATYQRDVVFEGDGALQLTGPSGDATRYLDRPQKGAIQIEQMVRVPKGSQVLCHVLGTGRGPNPAEHTGPMWQAGEGKFLVLHGNQLGAGAWTETGLNCEPDRWYKVAVRVDVAKQSWEFFVDGKRYEAKAPLLFRTKQDAVGGINYLTERPQGAYIDAVRVTRAP
jgi:hypothetical protein